MARIIALGNSLPLDRTWDYQSAAVKLQNNFTEQKRRTNRQKPENQTISRDSTMVIHGVDTEFDRCFENWVAIHDPTADYQGYRNPEILADLPRLLRTVF